MSEPTVDPVGTNGTEEFVDLAVALRARDPDYVPPFRSAILAEVSGAAASGGPIQPFIARRGAAAVGRVAALVNPGLVDAGGRPVGQVGFYECAEDPAAAAALLDAAIGWLRERGCARAVGPMNGGAHRAHRLLIDGFGSDPWLFEPRTPERYVAHFEAAGFAPIFRWTSHEPDRAAVAALARRFERVGVRGGFRLVPVASRDPSEVLPRLHPLLDRAWAGYPGYAPFPIEELATLFGPLLCVLPPGHLYLVQDAGGRDVGFGYMMPDWVEEVRALRGDPSGWGSWACRPLPKRVVMHTMALAPEARHGTAVAGLAAVGFRIALDAGYERFLMALTREDFRAHVRHLPATRRYALYGRGI
jgi:hypothetical protein